MIEIDDIIENGALLISAGDVQKCFDGCESKALDLIETALLKRLRGEVDLPAKISQIFDEKSQDRINCMPASILSDKVSGVKWVSVFPNNPSFGIRNVTGLIILSELEHGLTLSVMDGTYVTGLRTAAMGATAAKYLAREDAEIIGFIGAGQEAKRHLDMIKTVRPGLKRCYVSSRPDGSCGRFVDEESAKHPDMEIVNCEDDYGRAVADADIIVTATSTQSDLLKAKWIKSGALYIHVGGWEDEFAVAQKADKIVCDEWDSIKHSTQTISRMYKAGLRCDGDIYADIAHIINGNKPGRENDGEFIYFNSVGLSFIDVQFAKYTYDKCKELGVGTRFDFSRSVL